MYQKSYSFAPKVLCCQKSISSASSNSSLNKKQIKDIRNNLAKLAVDIQA